ncbi:MAG: BppU family phage baseplate upper protein, partial [Clostridia bacterium]|nr:BppU family phage baseplate upper protein [Clostridia bacterium]
MEIKYVNVNFKNGFADRVPTVTQYDYGQHLRITGLALPEAVEFHFKNQKSEETLLVAGITTDGITTVQIPNSMLKEPHNITVYVYVSNGESGKTVYRIDLNMRVRNAPQELSTDPNDEHYVNGVSELIAEAAGAANLAKESLEEAKNAKEICLSAAAATQALCDTLTPADAHYDKESWTAQSGVAVSEAIKELKTELSSSSLYANALRGEQEDKMLVIDDVSPIEHNIEFSVHSRNLICKEPRSV